MNTYVKIVKGLYQTSDYSVTYEARKSCLKQQQ